MRMRSEDPSPKWAAGERPLGLRGHAQDMFVALMARNFPQTTFHSSTSSEAQRRRYTGCETAGRRAGVPMTWDRAVSTPPWFGHSRSHSGHMLVRSTTINTGNARSEAV